MQNSTTIRLFLFSLLAFVAFRSAACQEIAVFTNDYSGVHYLTRLTAERLASTPEWLDHEPNPPLPVREAMLAARTHLQQLFDDGDEWGLGTLKLHPIRDRWVYEVSFCPPPPPECKDCICFPFTVVVPMDGRIIPEQTSPSKNTLPIAEPE